jgi:ribosomal protein S27AE
MTEYKGEPLVLSVTAEDIPWNYTRKHQAAGIYLWLCGKCHFHNWQENDECERCGESRLEDEDGKRR